MTHEFARNYDRKRVTALCRIPALALLLSLALIGIRPAQAQTYKVLYNFTGGGDGGGPQSSLTFDGAGNLYGTTSAGGLGYGTVFELSPNGNGGWNETVLYSFTGGTDGAYPEQSNVIFDGAGNLYGTAYGGGNGYGVVFELSPEGAGWTETVLHSFGVNSRFPQAGVIMDNEGNLYGADETGVFELSRSGVSWTFQVIYTSDIGVNGAGLTMDATGNIFGVRESKAFMLSPNGSEGWTPTVIYDFGPTAHPEGTPRFFPYQGTSKMLYGTTEFGGSSKQGTIYGLWNIRLTKNGTWQEGTVHIFKGGDAGNYPYGGVVFGNALYLPMYGTTTAGGVYNAGTVFTIGTDWKWRLLWSFNGTDGSQPDGSLVTDSAGNLYGTTYGGGSSGAGVVFELNPSPEVTTLTSSPNPSSYGQAVTFTAAVTSVAGAPPDGQTVTFEQGTTALGTGLLHSGSASFTTLALPVGKDDITAVYGGDSNFFSSTSNTVKQVVTKITTATTLSSSPNPSTSGQAVTFTASVSSSAGAPPDGETVTFKESATVLGTGTLSGGSASYTTSALPVGTNAIKAVYGGDTVFATSTSNVVKQVVNQ